MNVMLMELVDLEAPVLTYIFHIHVNVIPVLLEEDKLHHVMVSAVLKTTMYLLYVITMHKDMNIAMQVTLRPI